jgi:hypothetical protein
MRILFFVALVLLLTSGCTRMRNSFASAGEDLFDVVHLDLMGNIGTDMGGHVMVTRLVQINGYSTEDLYGVRMSSRHIGAFEESRDTLWIGPFHKGNQSASLGTRTPSLLISPSSMMQISPENMSVESPDEVGAGLQFLLVGARVGVRPLELLDLCGNVLTLDIMDDNPSWEERKMLRAASRSARQAARDAVQEETPKETTE